MQVIKPNSQEQSYDYNTTTIFLAGSIEMGSAENWQLKVESELDKKDVTIFNPRRDDWDSSWFQEEKNEQFNHQVNWEMNHMDSADVIFMYLDPNTKSPISLLELGLHADSSKIIVCCPPGFWRKGNVDIVCTRFGIPRFDKLDDAIGALKTKINQGYRQ
jgi:hypothetical protein